MSGLKELRRRQKTAMIIERMTGAMKMIARARYTSMQNDVRKNSGLTEGLQALARRIMGEMPDQGLPQEAESLEGESARYAQEGPKDAPWLLVVMTSDSGLCGGFNQKLIKKALEWLENRSHECVHVMCVGKKGLSVLQKKPHVTLHVDAPMPEPMPEPMTGQKAGALAGSANLLESVTSLFKTGRIRGCFVVYGRFFNILKQEPEVLQILPTPFMQAVSSDAQDASSKAQDSHPVSPSSHTGSDDANDAGDVTGAQALLTIEPDAPSVLNSVLEMMVQAILKKTMGEHKLSEHAARMNAMDSANTNAKDMIRRLQVRYNRLRQDRITKEIIEIVAGSEAARES